MKKLMKLVEAKVTPVAIDYKNPTTPDKVLNIDLTDKQTIDTIKKDTNVASATAGNRKLEEEAGRKFTTKESIAIGKEVVTPLIIALRDAKVEFKEGSKRRIFRNTYCSIICNSFCR